MSKEYEVMFKLGARLGENFKGTFSSAQKVLTATQKEIQTLNKTQNNISAYQKQQESIEKSNKHLDNYRKQLEITQKSLEELRKSTKDTTEEESKLVTSEAELKSRIASTELAISDKNQRLKQLGQSLEKAGIDTKYLSVESRVLDAKIKGLAEEEKKAADEVERYGSIGKSAFEAVANALEAAGIGAALGKIADAYKNCVSVSMEFGGTMSTVEALSGASASEMEELSAKAKQLGADTAFTANQAAEAMTYMGMAGWGAEDMLAGMDGVINLAAASGEDLALVSDIVTDNLTAFGLTAADTSHFVDVLAAAATSSNTNVSIMGETFKGSAAIAGALGYSIEDVAVAVGMMANAGVKGSVAGTALKNIFNGLLNGATLTSEAFGEVEFSAVNADGTIDSFSESINELRGYFEQMTDAERAQNAMLIAGQRGYNGLLAIINATDADYQSLTENINSCTNAAQKMADIKLDNLQGDVTLFESAADGLRMTIGEACDNELRTLVQLGTNILTGINDFCENNPAVVKGIIGIGASVGTVLAAYKSFVAIRKIMNTVSAVNNTLLISQAAATNSATAAQHGLNAAMSANPVGLILTSVGTLIGLLSTLQLSLSSIEPLCPTLEELTEKAREFDSALAEASGNFDEEQTSIYANADAASYYIDKLEEIETATNGNIAESEEYNSILTLLSSTIPELADYIDLETNSIKGGTEALRQHTEAYRTDAEEQARQSLINSVYEEYGEVIQEVAENKVKLKKAQLDEEKAQNKVAQTQERMNELMAEAERLAKENHTTVSIELADEYYELETALAEYCGDASAAAATQERLTQAIAKGEETVSEAKEALDLTIEAVNATTETVGNAADTTSEAYDAVSNVIANVSEQTKILIQSYNEAYQAAYDSISGQYALWDEAAETLPMSIQTITDALESQYEYWDNYNYNLQSLSKRTDDIEGLGEVIASFADGSEESVNAIAGMAEATDEELAAMVAHYTEQQKIQKEVADTIAQYQVDIDGEMDELVESMENAVENMDLSDAAAEAAKATMQAYADAILASKGSAIEAAEIVASATTSALEYANDYAYSPYEYYGYTKVAAQNAYASGTDNAASGIALVGEKGPELVAMRGGERVIDAENTKALLSGGSGAQITIAPQFVISGNVDEPTEDKLQEMSEKLIDMVKDALNEAGVDRQRSVYS